MVCRNLHQAYLQEVSLTQISGDHDFLMCFFSQHDIFQGRFHNRFQDWQMPPSSSLKLVEFETYYMKPNPPLFFRQQNMQWSRNMVHSHFTLCLRFRDYLKRLSQHPCYSLWMRVNGPPHYKVTALGSCVKHIRLKAHDHCVRRALICQKGENRPSSLHTRRWTKRSLHGWKVYTESYMADYA